MLSPAPAQPHMEMGYTLQPLINLINKPPMQIGPRASSSQRSMLRGGLHEPLQQEKKKKRGDTEKEKKEEKGQPGRELRSRLKVLGPRSPLWTTS